MEENEIRANYPRIPDHSDLRGFSYRAPYNYQWSDDHPSDDLCVEKTPSEKIWRTLRGFLGVGPKGYQRTDERIREEICEALTQHPGIDGSEIEVSVSRGTVTLRGTVPDAWMKRASEWAIEPVAGVRHLRNELKIL